MGTNTYNASRTPTYEKREKDMSRKLMDEETQMEQKKPWKDFPPHKVIREMQI